jgi:hypothetical protein
MTKSRAFQTARGPVLPHKRKAPMVDSFLGETKLQYVTRKFLSKKAGSEVTARNNRYTG